MARPLKEIDAEQVFEWASKGCTQAEIAGKFGCHQSTISRRFASDYELGLAECKTSLRAKQVERALDGSDTMLIHLGKVYLGQTDKIDVTSDGKGLQPIFERVESPRDQAILPPTKAAGILPE